MSYCQFFLGVHLSQTRASQVSRVTGLKDECVFDLGTLLVSVGELSGQQPDCGLGFARFEVGDSLTDGQGSPSATCSGLVQLQKMKNNSRVPCTAHPLGKTSRCSFSHCFSCSSSPF